MSFRHLTYPALALIVAGCSSGTTTVGVSGSSGPTSAQHQTPTVAPGDSPCVDANAADMSAPDLDRLIASSVGAIMPDSPPQQVDAIRQSWLQKADQTSTFPWGDIPPGGLANYARAVCGLLPAEHPNNFALFEQTRGAVFKHAVSNCEEWKGSGATKQKLLAEYQPKANQGDIYSKFVLAMLQFICPQIG